MTGRAFLLLFLAGSLPSGSVGCSTRVPLATTGQLCEYDEQCKQPLTCKCVRRRNPDDEGPDEILAPGRCQPVQYTCAPDGGAGTGSDTGGSTDTAPVESGTTDAGTIDTGATDTGDDADDSG